MTFARRKRRPPRARSRAPAPASRLPSMRLVPPPVIHAKLCWAPMRTAARPASASSRSTRAAFSSRSARSAGILLVDAAGQEAAVDGQHLSVHEARGVRGEEDGGARELLHLSPALHRRAHEELA